jgi:hypothetical protein
MPSVFVDGCLPAAAQEYLKQIEVQRTSTPNGDVCTVLDSAAAAPPHAPPATWRATFLGTGGALPSKHRNVSAILLSYKCDYSAACVFLETFGKPLHLYQFVL